MISPNVTALKAQRLYEKEIGVKWVAAEFGISRERIIDFSLNVNPLGPSEKAVDAASAAMCRANMYPDLFLGELRTKVSSRHDVDPARITFGCGLDEIIKLLVQAWCWPGQSVVIHVPTFPRYELEVRAHGAVPHFVAAGPPWTTSVSDIAKAVEEVRPALAFLCSPNNPTGSVIPTDEIETLIKAYPNTVFVVDEALAEPTQSGAMELGRTYNNIAILRTFSKYWGLAGFRVGYVVASEHLTSAIELIRPPFNVALPSAAAACAVLEDVDHLRRTHELFQAERSYFRSVLSSIQGVEICGSASNMMFLHLIGHSAPVVTRALAAQGILVVDAQSYRGLENVDVLRISLKERADNEALADALKEVMK